jgi:hypothetical protein
MLSTSSGCGKGGAKGGSENEEERQRKVERANHGKRKGKKEERKRKGTFIPADTDKRSRHIWRRCDDSGRMNGVALEIEEDGEVEDSEAECDEECNERHADCREGESEGGEGG